MSTPETAFVGVAERKRLVRLCATITGDRDAAEDLAQETLLEAWRNMAKLQDRSGIDVWLAAIARNVCRRWARRQGRQLATASPDHVDELPATDDAFADVERDELVALIESALQSVPADVGALLVDRYVNEVPRTEIGARLGISDDAVSMRLTRAKVHLRELLAPQVADHLDVARDRTGWQQTRVWCVECGRSPLLMRRERTPGVVMFRCPTCAPDPASVAIEYRLDNPTFARIVGQVQRPTAILRRARDWAASYYEAGLESGTVGCTRCGRSVPLQRYDGGDSPQLSSAHPPGVYASCEACGEAVSTSLKGLSLSLAPGREFRRRHPRLRSLPILEVQRSGVAAIVVSHQDVLSSSRLDVTFARHSLRVLDAHARSSAEA